MITELNPPALIAEAEKLTPMIRRAADSLAQATTAAEFIDAHDQSKFAYKAAKDASAFLKAKAAQVEVIAACHQVMGDALKIEAAALCRIADEYDAAQARGEVQTPGGDRKSINVLDRNNDPPTVTDIGLTRKLVHEARDIRDAEKAEPQIVAKTVDEKLKAGEAPQRADIKRATKKILDQLAAAKAPKQTAQHWQPPAPTTARSPISTPTNRPVSTQTDSVFEPPLDADGDFTIFYAAESYWNLMADYYDLLAEHETLKAEHEAEIEEHEGNIDDYNKLLAEHDADIDDYNKLSDQHNELLDENDELRATCKKLLEKIDVMNKIICSLVFEGEQADETKPSEE